MGPKRTYPTPSGSNSGCFVDALKTRRRKDEDEKLFRNTFFASMAPIHTVIDKGSLQLGLWS